MNATAIGTAVNASAKLWIVSPSSATESLSTTTTSWTAAVTSRAANEIRSARMPLRLVSSSESSDTAAS